MIQAVLAGVLIFVIGQIVIKFFLEPILELRELLGQVSNSFLLNQALILSVEHDDALENEMFSFAARLMAKRQAIAGYDVICRIAGLPSREGVLEGARNLNLIGNTLRIERAGQPKIVEAMTVIEEGLGIIVSYEKK